jgi:hypothetical protein
MRLPLQRGDLGFYSLRLLTFFFLSKQKDTLPKAHTFHDINHSSRLLCLDTLRSQFKLKNLFLMEQAELCYLRTLIS